MRKIFRSFKEELVAVALSLPIILFFSFQVAHFAHRNDADRVVWTRLPFWQTLEAFEYRLYDARFTARGTKKPESADNIVIVGLDENSFRSLPWPLPRGTYAKVIDNLKAAGASVIGVDFDFSQPQNEAEDTKLEKSLEKAGNVLLSSYFSPERKDTNSKAVSAVIYHTTTPLERFDQWTPDLATVYIPLDSDEHARRYPVYQRVNGSNVGGLAFLACAAYQKILDGNENKKYEEQLKSMHWQSLTGHQVAIPVVRSRVQDKSDAPLTYSTPLYFWGPQKTFATYSFSDVLQGLYSAKRMKELFGGKIVYIGPTAQILKDTFEAPSFPQATNQEREFIESSVLPGVEIHATATAMLLDGQFIRTVTTEQTQWTLLGLTLGASLWAALMQGFVSKVARNAQVWWTQKKWRGQIHTFVWFALYVLVGGLPILAFWFGAQWLFNNYNLWVVEAYPLLSAGSSTGLVLLYLFGVEAAERRKTQAHFARAVSPELMAKMVASGEDYLEPEEIYLTVLFTDLEGFTTYSESHPPKEVIDVTNDFLSAVVPIIHKYDGWVDKYIGDAIMAVFGAPVSRGEHAAVALRCAVEMQDAAAAWRKRTGIGFYMRVGIHTGEVITGSMGSRASEGSRERMDYTVIGDTVNLASRLEGKNKEFGSWIMCSAQTFNDAPGIVAAQSVSAPIKGKSKEVEVYIVHGLIDDPGHDKYWGKDVAP